MSAAIEQARAGIARGQSPFGAVVVRGDRVVSAGHNEVWLTGDPTAHAEVVAIRRAAAALGSIDLSGCEMHTTCEPCPMCAAAIHWAGLDAVHFGAAIADAAGAGFRELRLPAAEVLSRPGGRTRLHAGVMRRECADLFREWLGRPDRRAY